MEQLIDHMKACGWEEVAPGIITHENIDLSFGTWEEAIKGCIEVASAV